FVDFTALGEHNREVLREFYSQRVQEILDEKPKAELTILDLIALGLVALWVFIRVIPRFVRHLRVQAGLFNKTGTKSKFTAMAIARAIAAKAYKVLAKPLIIAKRIFIAASKSLLFAALTLLFLRAVILVGGVEGISVGTVGLILLWGGAGLSYFSKDKEQKRALVATLLILNSLAAVLVGIANISTVGLSNAYLAVQLFVISMAILGSYFVWRNYQATAAQQSRRPKNLKLQTAVWSILLIGFVSASYLVALHFGLPVYSESQILIKYLPDAAIKYLPYLLTENILLVLSAVAAIPAILIISLWEEFAYRAGLYNLSKKTTRGIFGKASVIIAVAAIFSLAHYPQLKLAALSMNALLFNLALLLALGLATTVVYEKTNSIRAPIAVHIFYSSYIVVIGLLLVNMPATATLWLWRSLFAAVGVGIVYLAVIALKHLKTQIRTIKDILPQQAISRFRTQDSLYFVGPVNEDEPQVVLRVQPLGSKASFSQARDYLNQYVQPTAQLLPGYQIEKFAIPAFPMKAQREALRLIHTETLVEEKFTSDLKLKTTNHKIALAESLERPLFVALKENEYIKNSSEADPQRVKFLGSIEDAVDGKPNPYAKLVRAFKQPSKEAFELVITKEDIANWDLRKWVDITKDLAKKATAGMRDSTDINFAWNPHYNINLLGTVLTALAYSQMLQKKYQKTDIDMMVGGESRYDTALNIDMLARAWSARGIKVHRPKSGKRLTIWQSSFITSLKRWAGGIYFTSSHSARNIFAGKILSTEGSQLLIEEMVELVDLIDQMITPVEKGQTESLTISFAAEDNSLIQQDIDNKDHPEPVDTRTLYTDYLKKGIATSGLLEVAKAAQARGQRIGYSMVHGSMTENIKDIFRQLGISDMIDYYHTQSDPYFGGVGIEDYNQKNWIAQVNQPKHDLVRAYVRKFIDLNQYQNLPVNSSLEGTISLGQMAKKLGQ
ncbi:MAG: CPBP family intramembrane metalloprotease, partial [Candidatus Omnitrophica bacterium]|nr:CPBP family intramembrane metalloprotease [Candidatus Omnitrophota bacterium]